MPFQQPEQLCRAWGLWLDLGRGFALVLFVSCSCLLFRAATDEEFSLDAFLQSTLKYFFRRSCLQWERSSGTL